MSSDVAREIILKMQVSLQQRGIVVHGPSDGHIKTAVKHYLENGTFPTQDDLMWEIVRIREGGRFEIEYTHHNEPFLEECYRDKIVFEDAASAAEFLKNTSTNLNKRYAWMINRKRGFISSIEFNREDSAKFIPFLNMASKLVEE